jgi:putative transposase
VHLLVEYLLKVPVSALANSLKGVSARRLRQRHRVRIPPPAPVIPLLPAASCGGPPPSTLCQYVYQQRTPGD